MKRNRSRSIVTIIGVLLSATLFTAVTVFTGSLLHFLKENYIYDLGNYHIRVRSVDDSFLKECKNDERTETLLVAENLGYAPIRSQNEDKPYLYVSSVDDDFFAQMPVHLTLGRLPENGDEILLPAHLADNGKVYYSGKKHNAFDLDGHKGVIFYSGFSGPFSPECTIVFKSLDYEVYE